MTVVGVVLVGLVAVALYGRRLARFGALQALRDAGASVVWMLRWSFYAVRSVVRLIAGEVRSW